MNPFQKAQFYNTVTRRVLSTVFNEFIVRPTLTRFEAFATADGLQRINLNDNPNGIVAYKVSSVQFFPPDISAFSCQYYSISSSYYVIRVPVTLLNFINSQRL